MVNINMAKKENMNFEDVLKKLEDITNKLEKESLTLDESVKLFEEGTELSKKCNEILENAEKRITILLNENGEIKEDSFTAED